MAKYKKEISEETFEQIESYLLNKMDEQARFDFEGQMRADAGLAAEVSLQQQLLAALETDGFMAAKPQQNITIRPQRNFAKWYMAAAAILVLLSVGFWFFKQRENSAGNLYTQFYQPDPGLPVQMGENDSTTYIFYDGMISYKEANYAQALSKWKNLPPRAVDNDTLQYYIAMAHFNAGAIDKSIGILKRLDKPGAVYYQQANWYIAMACLKKGDKASAKVILNKIRNYPGAVTLINKL